LGNGRYNGGFKGSEASLPYPPNMRGATRGEPERGFAPLHQNLPLSFEGEGDKGGEVEKVTVDKHRTILSALKQFHNELKSYKGLLDHLAESKMTTGHELRERNQMREKLVRKTGMFKQIIIELTDKQYYTQFMNTYDMWNEAFNPSDYLSFNRTALAFCITATNEAIGKLTDDITKGIRDKQGKVIGEPPKGATELPIHLFDKMQFHLKVIEASSSCFVAGNYREAILNAFISLIDYVKEMTGLDLDGDDLMNQVFSFNYDKEQRKITKYPIIRINELKNKTDRDEQHGFMFLCKGAAAFIRNPKAHKLIVQTDPLHTLEYLAFASLLFRQLDERKINTPKGAPS